MEHALLSGLRSAYVSGAAILDDPGAGQTINVSVYGGTCRIASGTRKLPVMSKAGHAILILADGAVTITEADDTAVAALEADEAALCMSDADGGWIAVALGRGVVSSLFEVATAAQLQSRLDNNLSVTLAASSIAVDDTIDIDAFSGGMIQGQGMTPPANNVQQGRNSHLYWDGARGGSTPMLQMGRSYFKLADLGLYGDGRGDITNGIGEKADVGIHITKEVNLGTGKMDAENVNFNHFTTAIKLATAADEQNVDESSWRHLAFYYCTTAIESNSGNVLGHHFEDPQFHLVDTCLKINAGGHFVIDGAPLYSSPETATKTDGKFIRLNNPSSDNWGPNGGSIHVQNLKLDGGGAVGVRVLDVETAATVGYERTVVRFTNLQPGYAGSSNWGGPMFYLSGNMDLIIDGCSFLYNDAIRWDVGAGGFCTVVIRDAYCPFATTYADLLDDSNSTGSINVRVENCHHQTAKIADTWITDGDGSGKTVGTVTVPGTG